MQLYSESKSKLQDQETGTPHFWSNKNPFAKSLDNPEGMTQCNGVPIVPKSYTASREAAINAATEDAADLTDYLYEYLPADHSLIACNLMFPFRNATEWKSIKEKLSKLVNASLKAHGLSFDIVGKFHITYNKAMKRDDGHFDCLAFISGQVEEHLIKSIYQDAIRQCGGPKGRSMCKFVADRSKSNLERICKYLYKSPIDDEQKLHMLRTLILKKDRKADSTPEASFKMTWTTKSFYRYAKTENCPLEYKYDGQHVEKKDNPLSGKQLIRYRRRLARRKNDARVPNITTPTYRFYADLKIDSETTPAILTEEETLIIRNAAYDYGCNVRITRHCGLNYLEIGNPDPSSRQFHLSLCVISNATKTRILEACEKRTEDNKRWVQRIRTINYQINDRRTTEEKIASVVQTFDDYFETSIS